MQIAWNSGRRYVALAAVSVALAALASSGFDRPVPIYQAGEFSDRSVRAPYDFVVADEDATRRQRSEAADLSPVVLDVIDAPGRAFDASVTQLIDRVLRAAAAAGPAPEPPPNATGRARREFDAARLAHRHRVDAALADALPPLDAASGQTVPAALGELLASAGGADALRAAFDALVAIAYARPVVMDLAAVWTSVKPTPQPEAYDVLLISGQAERVAREPGTLTRLAGAQQVLRGAPPPDGKVPTAVDAWLRRVVIAGLRPNAVVNVRLTNERRAAAARAVLPVSLSFRRNQLVIGEGQLVTAQTVLALDALRLQRSQRYSWTRVGVQAALLFVALSLAFLTFDGYRPRFVDADGGFTYGLFSIAVTASSFLAWDAIVDRLGATMSGSAALAMVIAFPAAALPMYTRLVAPPATVARLLVAQALVCGLLWQADARLAFFILTSGWIGSHLTAQCSRRQGVLRAGVVTGLVSAPVAAALIVLDSSAQGALGVTALAGLASGVLSALSVLALGPACELLFGHLTRIRLVELVNYQHPLLRRLTEVTPGTFQHSVGVGVLADAAARATGVDPLLLRVAALYHDVGKTKRPEMFVENQHGRNPHDELSPIASARHIIEHVPEGVRLLREHKLGDRVIDFVREHHGTAPVHYFLAAARKSGDEVDPRDFTYPGPSPRSLETLILMLADQVEATARSLPDAEPASLAAMVDRTIERARSDGQLRDCPVTQRDLTAIREALVTTAQGMAHRRIQYPGQAVTRPAPATQPDAAGAERG